MAERDAFEAAHIAAHNEAERLAGELAAVQAELPGLLHGMIPSVRARAAWYDDHGDPATEETLSDIAEHANAWAERLEKEG